MTPEMKRLIVGDVIPSVLCLATPALFIIDRFGWQELEWQVIAAPWALLAVLVLLTIALARKG